MRLYTVTVVCAGPGEVREHLVITSNGNEIAEIPAEGATFDSGVKITEEDAAVLIRLGLAVRVGE